MIKYNFSINQGWSPSMGIDLEYEMLWELWSCKYDYLHQIIQELEEVKSWERERMTFWAWNGFTTVFCRSDNDNAIIFYEKRNNNTWEWEDKELEVPLEEIYSLMNDWLKYIDKWEEETGKKFPR